MVFLSSRPEAEHHELVLMGGRTAGRKAKLLQQLSFHVDSLEELRRFHRAFKDEGVEISTTVTHGNTASIYFLDPETAWRSTSVCPTSGLSPSASPSTWSKMTKASSARSRRSRGSPPNPRRPSLRGKGELAPLPS